MRSYLSEAIQKMGARNCVEAASQARQKSWLIRKRLQKQVLTTIASRHSVFHPGHPGRWTGEASMIGEALG
jgi:hypothetical protein